MSDPQDGRTHDTEALHRCGLLGRQLGNGLGVGEQVGGAHVGTVSVAEHEHHDLATKIAQGYGAAVVAGEGEIAADGVLADVCAVKPGGQGGRNLGCCRFGRGRRLGRAAGQKQESGKKEDRYAHAMHYILSANRNSTAIREEISASPKTIRQD